MRPVSFAALVTLLLVALVAAVPGRAQATRPATTRSSDNAAPLYRQAFAAIPADGTPEGRILAEWWSVQLDANAKALLAAKQPALATFRQAAALPRCDWQVGNDHAKLMAVVSGSWDFADIVLLNARALANEKQYEQPFADLAALVALSRHVGQEPRIVPKQREFSLRGYAVKQAAELAPEAPPAVLETFAKRLDALPVSAPLGVAMRAEMRFINGELARMSAGPLDAAIGENGELTKMAKFVSGTDVAAAVAAWKDPAQRAAGIKEVAALGEQSAKYLDAVQAGRPSPDAAMRGARAAAGPLAKLIVPDPAHLRNAADKDAVEIAMVRAAMAVVTRGEAALNDYKDPITGERFTLTRKEGGFELRSKSLDGRRVLRAGRWEIK